MGDRLTPPANFKRPVPRKKVSLAIDTTPAARPGPSGVVVTDHGSLRGDGISVGMAGLRVGSLGGSLSGPQSTAASTASGSPSVDPDRLALSEFQAVRDLGEGTSGVVRLVIHKPSQSRYAMKVIPLGCSEQERKQILIEVRTLHQSDVPGIISFTNAFYCDNAGERAPLARHPALPAASRGLPP